MPYYNIIVTSPVALVHNIFSSVMISAMYPLYGLDLFLIQYES